MPDTHDYSAVDDAMRAESLAYREAIRLKRASALQVYGRFLVFFASAVALLAIGLAIALSILGFDLNPSPQFSNRNSLAAPESAKSTVSQIQQTVAEKNEQNSADVEITTSFTVFKTVETTDGASIVTGWIFEPNDLEVPQQQYCYWTHGSAQFESERVDIGRINAAGETLWLPVRSDVAGYAPQCQWF